jgi:hypothetical protein
MHPMTVGMPPDAPASACGMQSTIGTVGTGQLTPGIVAGKQDENGIVGKAASAASPSAGSAGRQSDTGSVIIGQLTPGIVGIHDRVGNPLSASSGGSGQFKPGSVFGGGQLTKGIVFGIHESGGIVGKASGFPAAPLPAELAGLSDFLSTIFLPPGNR